MGRRCHLLVLIIRVQMTVLPTECLFVSFIICLHSSKYFIIQGDCARSMPARLHSRSWHQCERLKSSATRWDRISPWTVGCCGKRKRLLNLFRHVPKTLAHWCIKTHWFKMFKGERRYLSEYPSSYKVSTFIYHLLGRLNIG